MLRARAAGGLVDVWKLSSDRPQQPPDLLDCQRLRRSPERQAEQRGMFQPTNRRPWRDGLQTPGSYAPSTAIMSTTALVGATGSEPETLACNGTASQRGRSPGQPGLARRP
jgi:hypothetical protein